MSRARILGGLWQAVRLSLLLASFHPLAADAASVPDGSPAGLPASHLSHNSLTEAERAWLRAHPVITLAHHPDWAPVEFSNERGELTGMSSDYLSLVELRLGVKFKRIPNLSWQEAFARQKRWEIDMATCEAASSVRSNFWAFTQPYLDLPIVIAAHADVGYIGDMKELFGKKVAVVKSSAIDDWVTHDFPEINLARFNSVPEGLAALQRSDVFAYLDNLLVIGDYQAKLKAANIKIAGQTPYVNAQRMAVRKDWAPLAGILNKALASISETERENIHRKWVTIRYEHGFDYALFWKVLAAFTVIVGALFLWIRKLTKEINARLRAEAALRQEMEELSRFFTMTLDLLCVADTDGCFRRLNPQWQTVLGYSLAELEGRRFLDLIHPDDVEATVQAMARLDAQHPVLNFVNRYRCQDGSYRWLEWRSSSQGELIYAAARDITERIQAEEARRESEQLFRIAFDNAPIGMSIIGPDGQSYLAVNPLLCEMFGYTQEEFMGNTIRLVTHPADEQRSLAWIRSKYHDEPCEPYIEKRYLHKDGHVVWGQVRAQWIRNADGSHRMAVAHILDVTKAKLAEEALRESEIFLKRTQAAGRIGSYVLEFTGEQPREQTWRGSEILHEIFGIDDSFPHTGEGWLSLVVQRDALVRDFARQISERRGRFDQEYEITRPSDGQQRWITAQGEVTFNAAGRPARLMGTVQDITERKRSEEMLLRVSTAVECASDAIGMADSQGRHFYQNKAFTELFDYTIEEINATGGKPAGYVDHNVAREVFAAIMSGGSWSGEVEMQSKRGRTFPVWMRADAIKDKDGRVIGLVGVHTDITGRKQAEQALRASEEKFSKAFHTSPDAININRLADGVYVATNRSFTAITGYSEAEVLGKTSFDLGIWSNPDDRQWLIQELREKGEVTNYETSFRLRDGRVGTGLMSATLIDLNGVPHILSITRDITERKQAEAALAESMTRLQTVVTGAPIVLYSFDRHGVFTLSEGKGLASLGLKPGEIVGRTVFEVYGSLPEPIAALRRALSGETFTVELSFPAGGTFEASHVALRDAAGAYNGTIGVLIDVTERERAQAALRASEFLLRKSQAVARLGSYYLDARTGQWIGSAALDEIFGIGDGYSKDVAGWIALVHPNEKEELLQYLTRHVLAGRNRFEKEYRIIRYSDGGERWVYGLGELEFDGDGNPIKMIGTIQDITERKRAEEALRESEERFATFMDNLPAGAFMKDVPGEVIYANRYLCDLFGWGNVVGRSTRDLLPPEVAEKMEAEDRAALAHGPLTVTEQVRDVTNCERVFQTSKFPISRVGREPLLGGIAVDVTERKQVEEALRTSLEEKVVLLKEVHHRVKNNLQIVSSMLNLQGRKVQNPEFQAFLRDTQGRIRAMSLLHETLYGSGNLARVRFRDYVQTVCSQILRSYASDTRSISIKQVIAEVLLPLDQAIPAGLILNELLSNAFKHAFADRLQGEITVQLQVADERYYALRVADDGVGLPAGAGSQDPGTLGLCLVEGLVRQLEGQLSVIHEAGTTFQIVFPIQHP